MLLGLSRVKVHNSDFVNFVTEREAVFIAI